MSEIRVQIGADVNGAITGLSRVNNSLTLFQTSAGKATAAMQRLPGATNQSTQAMVNLSRVVQDAPYGFIGIANNLNPLLESFQRLKATTGTTGGAFKELGKSLIGPGGIGLAIGLVSSLLVMFGSKLFGASKAAKEADEENKKLAKGFADSAVKLASLVGIVTNLKTSYEDKKLALKAINEEYGGYLRNLGIEEVTVGNITSAYDKLIESMIRQAVVKGLQNEIAKAVEETAKQLVALEMAEERKRLAQEKANNTTTTTISAYDKMSKSVQQFNSTQRDGILAQAGANEEQTAAIGAINNHEAAVARLKKILMDSIAPAMSLVNSFSDLGIVFGKDKNKPAKDLKDFLKDLMVPIKVQEKDVEFPLNFKWDSATFQQMFGKDMVKAFESYDATIIKAMKAEEKARKIKEAVEGSINEALGEIQIDGLSSVGEAIGAALTGGDVASVFKSFINSVAGVLQQLGKQLIAIGVAAKAVQKSLFALFTNPGLAIAAGIGLVAAGAAFKGVLAKGASPRAAGGPVAANRAYRVGEIGEEIFVPSTHGRMIPNNKLQGLAGMGGQHITLGGEVMIDGQKLRLVLARTDKSQNRY